VYHCDFRRRLHITFCDHFPIDVSLLNDASLLFRPAQLNLPYLIPFIRLRFLAKLNTGLSIILVTHPRKLRYYFSISRGNRELIRDRLFFFFFFFIVFNYSIEIVSIYVHKLSR